MENPILAPRILHGKGAVEVKTITTQVLLKKQ
jgi:hypothetical protein